MYLPGWVVCACFIFITICIPHVHCITCSLPTELTDEIKSYQEVVDKIISAAIQGSYSGKVYDDLADFLDTFGHRLAGTENLENSIDDLKKRMKTAGLKVRTNPVVVPVWTRGAESLNLVSPRNVTLSMLSLGLSVGTPPEGITAEVVVVEEFEHLTDKNVKGKIVLFNKDYVSYSHNVKFRTNGAMEAAKAGAVAALVRSITSFSIDSPHTGMTKASEDVKDIPAVAVSLESADLLARLVTANKSVLVNLKMEATHGGNKVSHNIIADLNENDTREYVVLSGHIDSWDVGQGAVDDAGGVFVSWHALALLKSLDLPPTRRTLRTIAWTGEEVGLLGSRAYLVDHSDEIKNWTIAFESDAGVFEAAGFKFAGSTEATCILQEIANLMGSGNGTEVQRVASAGSDISVLPADVPKGELKLLENPYWWFHHTSADTLNVMKKEFLDQNTALYAAMSYVLANISIPLPRESPPVRRAGNLRRRKGRKHSTHRRRYSSRSV